MSEQAKEYVQLLHLYCSEPWMTIGAKPFAIEAATLIEQQVARIAELEQERDTAATERHDRLSDEVARAEAAEAEVKRLREAQGRYEWEDQQIAKEQAGFYKRDTAERVCFYEQDFYIFSNFSAFTIKWKGYRFDTSEAVYHFEKFAGHQPDIANEILLASSAHEAFKLAERHKRLRRPDWDVVKVDVMRTIIRAKVAQHEYVRRKLLLTDDRELVEDSWRDAFWGWGPNRDGQNMLGKIWMEVREDIKPLATQEPRHD